MRFNPSKYDPAQDSSPGAPKTGNLVIVYNSDSECRSGQGGNPKNPKSRFVQGMDARLKGALIRAAIADVKVEVRDQGKPPAILTPVAFAKQFGFGDKVATAKSRYADAQASAKAKAAERAIKAKERAAARQAAKKAAAPKKAAAKKAAPAKKATKASKATTKKAAAPAPAETVDA